ncbi:hypothetical protein GCM10007304_30340 [Rhodococcoides trifolii]|uniref:Uncharacterized protein n=1 Tax=Rhodococcoides trifolii TaxID=908250 RepID=A0A917FYG6_9NOCA|nr:hypothetical protein [Rhodococcus trifolii]GGG14176.1 hypothetical protein GCM10007304_30340 [Rhodococcus trifolii]
MTTPISDDSPRFDAVAPFGENAVISYDAKRDCFVSSAKVSHSDFIWLPDWEFGPRILADLFEQDLILEADLGEIVQDSWVMADRPTANVSSDRWIRIWSAANTTIPTVPEKLFRGGISYRGMSWTASYEVAEEFAWSEMRPGDDPSHGKVFSYSFSQQHVIGYMKVKSEDEYIIDPRIFDDATIIPDVEDN